VGGDKVSEVSASSLIGSFSYFRAALPFQPRSRSADLFWRSSPLDLAGLATGPCVSKASKGADPTPNSDLDLWSPKGKSIELPQLGFVLAKVDDGAFPGEQGWPPLREPVCRPSDSLALTETSVTVFLLFYATISFVSCRIRPGDKWPSCAFKMASSSCFGNLPTVARKITTPW